MPNPWDETGAPVDRCADLPDAPTPEPFRPPPGTYARHGRKKPKNLYLVTPDHPDGLDIGRLDTPEMAALVVEALNHQLGSTGFGWEYGMRALRQDGTTTVTWFESEQATEEAIEHLPMAKSGVALVEMVRRPVTYGAVEEVPDGD